MIKVLMVKKSNKQVLQGALAAFMMIVLISQVGAEETIIQQEKLSFERCLKVIATSQDKLFVAPEITDVSDRERVATFPLADGTLTIRCDGLEGNVTVSTNTN